MSEELDLSQKGCEAAVEDAKASGMTVVHAHPNLLLLDIDDEASWKVMHNGLSDIASLRPGLCRYSKSKCWTSAGGNRHVQIELREELPIARRLLLQAALGSDRKKELYSFLKLYDGVAAKYVSMLFRPKSAKVVEFRFGMPFKEKLPATKPKSLPKPKFRKVPPQQSAEHTSNLPWLNNDIPF